MRGDRSPAWIDAIMIRLSELVGLLLILAFFVAVLTVWGINS